MNYEGGLDFNDYNCANPNGGIQNWDDPHEVKILKQNFKNNTVVHLVQIRFLFIFLCALVAIK